MVLKVLAGGVRKLDPDAGRLIFGTALKSPGYTPPVPPSFLRSPPELHPVFHPNGTLLRGTHGGAASLTRPRIYPRKLIGVLRDFVLRDSQLRSVQFRDFQLKLQLVIVPFLVVRATEADPSSPFFFTSQRQKKKKINSPHL